jgi:hypothetical protein
MDFGEAKSSKSLVLVKPVVDTPVIVYVSREICYGLHRFSIIIFTCILAPKRETVHAGYKISIAFTSDRSVIRQLLSRSDVPAFLTLPQFFSRHPALDNGLQLRSEVGNVESFLVNDGWLGMGRITTVPLQGV